MGVTRREFVKLGFGGIIASSLDLKFLSLIEKKENTQIDKNEKFIRSTCSPNCTGACGFLAGVSKGKINTLIQSADYPEEEYNPRGCLKGLSMMNLIYGKDRIKYPLIRTGPRGSGEFRRATWEEALDYTAEKLKEIEKKYGSKSVAVTVQVPGTGYVNKGALVRLTALSNWTIHHGYDQNGDLPMFWPMTFGVQSEELESLEWLNSRYTMIFGSNIMKTRLPDAKQLIEAKANGKIIVIDPDATATTSKADEWIKVKFDTDAALALGMAKFIIDKKLYDEQFLKNFTDMPILIRKDNGKRLLAKDVKKLADIVKSKNIPEYRENFVIHDGSDFIILNPESTKSQNAKIHGDYLVELIDGSKVEVQTVFDELNKTLKEYTLEKTSEITGVQKEQIKRIATEASTIKPLHIIIGAGGYQWYHSDLKGRAISLLPVLTGNIGKSGSGISTYAGQYRIRFNLKEWWFPKGGKLNWVPYLYFLQGKGKKYPKNGIKAMIQGWGNPFDQHNLSNVLKNRATSGQLEFILTTDFTMTTTCQWSDVIFPAASFYEKYDLTATALHPYLQLQQPVIKPLFESKTELYMFRELAKRLNPDFEKEFYPNLNEEEASLKIIDTLLKTGGYETEGITLDMLKKGPVRLRSHAPNNRQIPFYEMIENRLPFPPPSYPAPIGKTAQFVKSGRIEFYKDEDLFIETGENLPVYKETFVDTEYKLDPSVKDKYKLRFITKNSLYRVHSTHSNNQWLLELQDYKPKVFINKVDAKKRNIKDGDFVEIYNNRGKVSGYAVISGKGSSEGSITFEQGWWSKYTQNESFNSLLYPWVKPIHEIYFLPGMWTPTTCWNESLVEVRKVHV